MKSYSLGQDQEDLIELPRLHDTPGYEVIEGDPRCSIRMDRGTQSTRTRLGVWMCTPGTFRCVEKGDELQTVIEGRLVIVIEDGSSSEFGPGDSFFTQKGERVTWKIVETVKKVFFTYDAEGSN
jgi:uncharacterized cupin superfamily protein